MTESRKKRCQEYLSAVPVAGLEAAADTERRNQLCQDCRLIGVTNHLECAWKKVVKQANIDKVQANVSCAESDLLVYYTENSQEESKEESNVRGNHTTGTNDTKHGHSYSVCITHSNGESNVIKATRCRQSS